MAVYSDINTLYATGKNNQGLTITDTTALRQMISNVLTTRIGTRFGNRAFGSDFDQYLFKTINEDTAQLVRMEAYNRLTLWLPFLDININDITVTADVPKKTYYLLIHVYDTNTNATVDVPLILTDPTL